MKLKWRVPFRVPSQTPDLMIHVTTTLHDPRIDNVSLKIHKDLSCVTSTTPLPSHVGQALCDSLSVAGARQHNLNTKDMTVEARKI